MVTEAAGYDHLDRSQGDEVASVSITAGMYMTERSPHHNAWPVAVDEAVWKKKNLICVMVSWTRLLGSSHYANTHRHCLLEGPSRAWDLALLGLVHAFKLLSLESVFWLTKKCKIFLLSTNMEDVYSEKQATRLKPDPRWNTQSPFELPPSLAPEGRSGRLPKGVAHTIYEKNKKMR